MGMMKMMVMKKEEEWGKIKGKEKLTERLAFIVDRVSTRVWLAIDLVDSIRREECVISRLLVGSILLLAGVL
jgi:hypothetical protein